jgi:hypothetical protein
LQHLHYTWLHLQYQILLCRHLLLNSLFSIYWGQLENKINIHLQIKEIDEKFQINSPHLLCVFTANSCCVSVALSLKMFSMEKITYSNFVIAKMRRWSSLIVYMSMMWSALSLLQLTKCHIDQLYFDIGMFNKLCGLISNDYLFTMKIKLLTLFM